MPIALTPSEEYPYVLESERALPAERRTTFWLRALTKAQEREVFTGASNGQADVEFGMDRMSRGVRLALARWENWRYATGSEVALPERDAQGRLPEEIAHLLSPNDRLELWRAVQDRSVVRGSALEP